jgi:hypothetical protein
LKSFDHSGSRRSFLRVAIAAPIAAAAAGMWPQLAGQDAAVGEANSLVAGVRLDRELFHSGEILHGEISFRKPASGALVARWLDSFGRVVEQVSLPSSGSGVAPQRFSFDLARGLTYCNWIRVWVGGTEQTAGARFLLSPPPNAWDDFHVIMWAHYPDGFYDLLREAGVDGTIAYRDGDFTNVLDNNFNFYVEQMTWEVFAIYHKNQPLWRGLLAQIEFDRNNLALWERKPCVNDPKTDEYVRRRVTHDVRLHRAFRPLFYNIADELGQGDQIRPNDFCHSAECTIKFAEYLRKVYGPSNALQRVQSEWSLGELTRWDDDSVRNGAPWLQRDLMINRTTTDLAFDAVALAALRSKYGSLASLNKAWGTSFPASREAEYGETWGPLLAVVRETRSVPELTEDALEKRLGSLDKANERWGSQASFGTPDQPTNFKSWPEVATFVRRFYRELSEVRSTVGWNVAPWCDFRNFMDATFADAIGRARAICKAEDPHARCATEGGQCPFAFGWYNYENVVKVVDVIEPYNIGNNVEVIRSLNPEVMMVSTHGFEHQPGNPLTAQDRLFQKRAVRPIWWGLFHGHRGTLIWDDLEPSSRFVNADRQLTPSAETFAATFKELHDGIGKLFINSQRLDDGIAIHYSQASMQIHWLLDNVQNARQWTQQSSGDRDSHFTGVRNSWTKLIEDLGLQYNFVGRGQIEEGSLNVARYRAFIMPQSLAVSANEAEAIRQFVRAGGLLIADYRAASMDEHGRDLGHGPVLGTSGEEGAAGNRHRGTSALGQLDDVFGIARTGAHAQGNHAVGQADFESLRLRGKRLNVIVGDETVSVTTGKPMAQCGDVPLVIVNNFGDGKAVFLNLEMASYAYDRLQTNSSTSLPEIVEGVFGLAQISAKVRVLGSDGERLPGTEVVRFANGPYEHVAVFRNPQFDDGGWGSLPTMPSRGWAGEIDNTLLEKNAQVTVAWPEAQETYEVRRQRGLGRVAKVQTTLDSWSPLVFTRASEAVPALTVEAPERVTPAAPLVLTLRDEAPLADGSFRIVHLQVFGPNGKPYGLYARNLLVRATSHIEQIPLAFNDPPGTWRVVATDVMTGRESRAAFTFSS